jgi:hypothetical protein
VSRSPCNFRRMAAVPAGTVLPARRSSIDTFASRATRNAIAAVTEGRPLTIRKIVPGWTFQKAADAAGMDVSTFMRSATIKKIEQKSK